MLIQSTETPTSRSLKGGLVQRRDDSLRLCGEDEKDEKGCTPELMVNEWVEIMYFKKEVEWGKHCRYARTEKNKNTIRTESMNEKEMETEKRKVVVAVVAIEPVVVLAVV